MSCSTPRLKEKSIDWSTQNCPHETPSGLYKVYRQISNSVPHRDQLYPSCSRYIREMTSQAGLIGFIAGIGRFAGAHMALPSSHRPMLLFSPITRWVDMPEDHFIYVFFNQDEPAYDHGYTLTAPFSVSKLPSSTSYDWSLYMGFSSPCFEGRKAFIMPPRYSVSSELGTGFDPTW